jgi:CO/xanthine dehydrogenase FAD-binding subunit
MVNPKHYYRPKTLAEALERAAQLGSIALAGGALAFQGLTLSYETVVDLQDIEEINTIEVRDDGLHIGGAVLLQTVIESPHVSEALKWALKRTVPPNICNNTSVGETLMVTDSAALPLREWLAALCVLGATIEYAGHAESGQYSLWSESLSEFVHMIHGHHHPFEGVICRLQISNLPERAAIGTAYVSRTPADAPIVNAAAIIHLSEDGHIINADAAVCGASKLPILLLDLKSLNGKPLNESSIADAVKSIPVQVNPEGDYLGSADYRREMARVCVRRALEMCMQQLG